MLEVLVLLVGTEEGFLLEFRISCPGSMLKALLLLQYPLLLSVLGLHHGALLRLIHCMQHMLAGSRLCIRRRPVGEMVVLGLLVDGIQLIYFGLEMCLVEQPCFTSSYCVTSWTCRARSCSRACEVEFFRNSA